MPNLLSLHKAGHQTLIERYMKKIGSFLSQHNVFNTNQREISRGKSTSRAIIDFTNDFYNEPN